MQLNVSGFLDTLPIVVYGMGGIFVVLGVIFCAVKGLMFFGRSQDSADNQN